MIEKIADQYFALWHFSKDMSFEERMKAIKDYCVAYHYDQYGLDIYDINSQGVITVLCNADDINVVLEKICDAEETMPYSITHSHLKYAYEVSMPLKHLKPGIYEYHKESGRIEPKL